MGIPIRVIQVIFLFVAACGVVIASVIAQSASPSGGYWFAFYAWVAALLLLVVSFIVLPARSQISALGQLLQDARLEVVIVIGLTVIAFALRASDLTEIPYPFAGDEASIGLEGRNILSGLASNMFISGWQSEPSMSFLPWALSMAIFGKSIFGLRILAATVGALSIPALYLLARSLLNAPIAVLSAVFLAVMSVHIHFSRIAVNNASSPFLACVVFWLIQRAVKTRQSYWFAAAGLMSGLTLYSFVGSRLVAILAGVYLIYASVADKALRDEWHKLVVFGLIAGLAVLPLSIFFWQHPDIAFARINQMGVFQNGWLDHTVQQTGQSPAMVMAKQISQSFLVFVSTPAPQGFYNSPGPLFDPLWSFFLICGILSSTLYLRTREYVWMQLWFWSVVLLGGALLVPPPFAERYTIVFPLIALYVAMGVWSIVSLISKVIQSRSVVKNALTGVCVLALAISSLRFYFFEYIPRHYFTDPNSEVGMEFGQYLATVPRDASIYFMGEPRMFYDFPSITFLSDGLGGFDLPPNVDPTPLIRPGREAIFVALPQRREQLERVRKLYPGGSLSQVPRRTNPEETLYLAYTVKP